MSLFVVLAIVHLLEPKPFMENVLFPILDVCDHIFLKLTEEKTILQYLCSDSNHDDKTKKLRRMENEGEELRFDFSMLNWVKSNVMTRTSKDAFKYGS